MSLFGVLFNAVKGMETGGLVEGLFLKEVSNGRWRVLLKNVGHYRGRLKFVERCEVEAEIVQSLEAGEHEPSLAMLSRLARVLGLEFHIDITRGALRLTA